MRIRHMRQGLAILLTLLFALTIAVPLAFADPIETTNPKGTLTTVLDFDDLTDTSDFSTVSSLTEGTDFTFELMDDGAGGNFVRFTDTGGGGPAVYETIDVSINDWSDYDELCFWQDVRNGTILNGYYTVSILTSTKTFMIPEGGAGYHGTQSAWTPFAAGAAGIYTAMPQGESMVRLPLENFESSGAAITEDDLQDIQSISFTFYTSLYVSGDQSVSIDSLALFKADQGGGDDGGDGGGEKPDRLVILDFNDWTDLTPLDAPVGGVAGTDYTFTLKNDGEGEDGKYIEWGSIRENGSIFSLVELDLASNGIETDWSQHDSLMYWQQGKSAYGAYYSIEIIANGKTFVLDANEQGFYSYNNEWKGFKNSYSTFSAGPNGEEAGGIISDGTPCWVNLPFSAFKSGGAALTETDLANVTHILFILPCNEYLGSDCHFKFDTFTLFRGDLPDMDPGEKIPYQNTPVNDAFVTGDPKVLETKMLFGAEQFDAGTQLGQKSEKYGFVVDNSTGSSYNMQIRNDDKGQNGKYMNFSVIDRKVFNYGNPIFVMTQYDTPPTDWSDYNEIWVWLDFTGYGPQFQGNVFQISAVEFDYDGDERIDPTQVNTQRWGIKENGLFYLQDGNGWAAYQSNMASFLRVPKDFKGWLRLPFDQMAIEAAYPGLNATFDMKEVVQVVLGFPCDPNTVGYSMNLDSLMLVKTTGAPEGLTPTITSNKPTFTDEIVNIPEFNCIVEAFRDHGLTDITLNVRDVSDINSAIFETMMEEDLTLTLNVYDDNDELLYTWIINGKGITEEKMTLSADMGLKFLDVSDIINTDKGIAFIVGTGSPEFPGTQKLKVFVGEDFAKVTLYHMDENGVPLEIAKDLSVVDGWATLAIKAAGTYALAGIGGLAPTQPTTSVDAPAIAAVLLMGLSSALAVSTRKKRGLV